MSLVPKELKSGSRSSAAPHIVDRICRRYLIDLVRVGGNGGPRRPEDVLNETMQTTVESVADHKVKLRIDGSARLATHDVGSGASKDKPKIDEFRLTGFAVYDRTTKQFSSFKLIAFSETGHYDEIHKKVLPLGVLFELSPDNSPADRVPPSSFLDHYFILPRYFFPEGQGID